MTTTFRIPGTTGIKSKFPRIPGTQKPRPIFGRGFFLSIFGTPYGYPAFTSQGAGEQGQIPVTAQHTIHILRSQDFQGGNPIAVDIAVHIREIHAVADIQYVRNPGQKEAITVKML